jgi:RNA polymerase sigma factor (sigma-70 family)
MKQFDKLENEKRTKMYDESVGLIHYILKKMHITQSSYDEAFLYGEFGLIKAIDYFDETRNIKFSTFACLWIRCYITWYLEKCINNGKRKKHVTTSFLRRDEKSFGEPSDCRYASPLRSIERKELLSILESSLDQKRYFVLYEYFFNKLTFKEIGKMLGVSAERARQILVEGVKKIKDNVLNIKELLLD